MRGGAAVTTPIRAPRAPVPVYLRALRVATAGLATAAAVIYLLIGFRVLQVVEVRPSDPSLMWFGIPAAAAFLFGAVVILVSDRMLLWVAGAFFQVFTIFAYVGVAEDRTPPYEFWGIALRVVQALILVALVVLISRYPQTGRGAGWDPGRRRPIGRER
jgi:hypothetical protein